MLYLVVTFKLFGRIMFPFVYYKTVPTFKITHFIKPKLFFPSSFQTKFLHKFIIVPMHALCILFITTFIQRPQYFKVLTLRTKYRILAVKRRSTNMMAQVFVFFLFAPPRMRDT